MALSPFSVAQLTSTNGPSTWSMNAIRHCFSRPGRKWQQLRARQFLRAKTNRQQPLQKAYVAVQFLVFPALFPANLLYLLAEAEVVEEIKVVNEEVNKPIVAKGIPEQEFEKESDDFGFLEYDYHFLVNKNFFFNKKSLSVTPLKKIFEKWDYLFPADAWKK